MRVRLVFSSNIVFSKVSAIGTSRLDRTRRVELEGFLLRQVVASDEKECPACAELDSDFVPHETADRTEREGT